MSPVGSQIALLAIDKQPRHGFHSTGHHQVAVAGLDGLSGQKDSLQRPAASLGNSELRDLDGIPRVHGHGRAMLGGSSPCDIAEKDDIPPPVSGVDAGSRDGLFDDEVAIVRSVTWLKAPPNLPTAVARSA